jgi:hypothetical protein
MRPFHGMSRFDDERSRTKRELRFVAGWMAAPLLLLTALAWWLS